jgi:ABC-type branched-subunit amino acid transport system substrate-binding protein
MNKKSNFIQNIGCFFLAIALVAGCWGCAKKPVKLPADTPPAVEEKKPEKDTQLTRVLIAEAEKFSAEGNHQDALFVYNQALSLADPQDREIILSGIEAVLAKTVPSDIESFLQIKNLSIPHALLLYWLGLNYATQNNYFEAGKALGLFIDAYPDHAYAEDARDLLAAMKSSAYKRDTIGCLLPLSGKYQVFGQRALQGIQVAIQDLSKAHDREFYVIIKDTQSDPERAVLCVEELNQEKVAGILGPLLSPDAAGLRAESLGIPMMALTQKSEFPLQGEYLFSNFITPEMQVQSLASYVFQDLGLKKVAILYPKERYGERYMELFWDVVDEFNGEVVGVESYDGTKTDFAVPIQKLTGEYYPVPDFLIPEIPEEIADEMTADEGESGIQNPPYAEDSSVPEEEDVFQSTRDSVTPFEAAIEIDFQALFIPDSVSRVNLILPQLAFNDARGMVLLGTNLWHQESLVTGAKGYNKNAVITDGYFGDSENPITAGFEKHFIDLYDTRPGFIEAISYDTAFILFTAAMDEAVDSRESLKNILQEGRVYRGVTGDTWFDKTGSAHKELFLITVKNEKFMEIRH